MNKLLRNSLTARETVPTGQTFEGVSSETQPNQTLSIREIVEKYVQGIDLGVQSYEPMYTDEELPNFEYMDFDELHEYRQHLADERFRLEAKLQSLKEKERSDKASSMRSIELQADESDGHSDDMPRLGSAKAKRSESEGTES